MSKVRWWRATSAWLVSGAVTIGALGGLGGATLTPAEVHAQDRDDDPDKRASNIAKYRQILEGNPTEGFVFKQLLREVGYGQQLEKLIEEYRAKADAEPSKLNYRLILGHLLKAAKRYPEAEEAYTKATEISPKSVDAWLGLGLTLQLHKRQAEAGPAFEKALAMERDKARKQDILRKLADIAFAQRDWDAAERYYDELIRLDPGNNYLRQEYADVLVQYKRYEQALKQYEAMRDRAGRNVKERATAMKDIGDVYALMERYDDALKVWKQASALVAGDSYLQREIDQRVIQVYRDQNRLSELAAQYEKSWGRPDYDQAMTLGGLYDELGDEDKALSLYRAALDRNGSSVDARMKVIRILERRGETDKVIAEYERLIRSDSKQASYQFELANIHHRNGDTRKAARVASDIARRFSNDPVTLSNLAELHLRWGQRDEALAIYQKLTRVAPNDPENLIALGEFHWQEGDRKKALSIWQKILTAMPIKYEAHATLAQVYADHAMPKEAVEQYEAAIKLDPQNDSLYRGLAIVYERSRQRDKAIAAWTELLDRTKRGPLRSEARSKVIQLYMMSGAGQLRRKKEEFRAKFQASPPDRQAGYFLGEAHIALKEFDQAEAVFQKLVEQNPDDVEALLSLHTVYNQTSAHKKNIEVLREIARLVPLRARDYYHQIAELSLKLYEDDQAIEFASMAVDLNPNDAGAHARLGRLYRQMQDLRRAVAEYRTALDLDGQAFPYYFELAEIHLALDQIREADQLYRQLTKRARDDSMILRAGRKAIDINDSLGTLASLESELAPLINAQRPRKAYGRLLIELYDRMTRGLIAAVEYGPASQREEAEKQLREVSRRALGPLLQNLQDDDVTLKLTAIRILGDLRNGNAALPLARLIEERDPEIRVRAALASGKLGDERALQPMLRALSDNELAIRQIAVWAVGRMEAKEAAPELQKLLRTDAPWTLRALSAVSLGRLGDAGAVDLLGELLASSKGRDQKTEVRVACAWGLGAIASPKARAHLVQAISADPEPAVRRMAAWGLGNLATDPQALASLLEAYWTTGPEVREVAGKALLRLGGEAATGKPPYVVWEEHLGFFNVSEKAFQVDFFLDTLLSDELLAQGDDGSYAIVQGEEALKKLLARQIDQAQAEHLAYLLYDLDQGDEQIGLGALTWSLPRDAARRAKVVAALGRIGAALSPKLITLLGSGDPLVRAHAAGILGKIGDKAAVDPLIKALGDEHKDVRRKAALALGRIGDGRATQPLLKQLGDEYWASRAHAASALGRLGDGGAVDPLVKALDDKFPWVQASAAEALGMLGDARATPALLERLDKAPAPVKIEILRALARLGGSKASEALKRYSDDPDPRIREAVGQGG